MINREQYYLGIGIRNVGSTLAGYGNRISDSGFDGKEMDISAGDMLANLEREVEKLRKLLAEASIILF